MPRREENMTMCGTHSFVLETVVPTGFEDNR